MTYQPTAVVTECDDPAYRVVTVRYEGVDRPETCGIVCRVAHVPRLVRAIEDGAAFTNPRLAVDIHGQTYVQSTLQVRGKALNADLRRLGY